MCQDELQCCPAFGSEFDGQDPTAAQRAVCPTNAISRPYTHTPNRKSKTDTYTLCVCSTRTPQASSAPRQPARIHRFNRSEHEKPLLFVNPSSTRINPLQSGNEICKFLQNKKSTIISANRAPKFEPQAIWRHKAHTHCTRIQTSNLRSLCIQIKLILVIFKSDSNREKCFWRNFLLFWTFNELKRVSAMNRKLLKFLLISVLV